jgi:hypothetical protein
MIVSLELAARFVQSPRGASLAPTHQGFHYAHNSVGVGCRLFDELPKLAGALQLRDLLAYLAPRPRYRSAISPIGWFTGCASRGQIPPLRQERSYRKRRFPGGSRTPWEENVNGLIYLIGLIVVILFILSFLGLR